MNYRISIQNVLPPIKKEHAVLYKYTQTLSFSFFYFWKNFKNAKYVLRDN